MKIIEEYPPNFGIIDLVFPHNKEHCPIFCFGNVIYNPYKVTITKDLEVHEEAHSKRQGNNPNEWWMRYLENKEFRLQEEIIAYGVQLAFINSLGIPAKIRQWKEEKLAEGLSSNLYNLGISYGEAKSKIRNYAKNI